MKKRIFPLIFTLCFIIILIFQYKLNFDKRIKPPCDEWAKEVLISSGNITNYPKIIKYKEDYIIAHNDGDNIKIITVDNTGKKLNEKLFPAEDSKPRDINLLTDGNNIYVNWIISSTNGMNINMLKLDNSLNIKDKSEIKNIRNKTQVSDNILIISFEDRIEVRDLRLNKTTIVKTDGTPGLICGTKYKDMYLIVFQKYLDDFNYFTVKDGIASEPQFAATAREWSRVKFNSVSLTTDGKEGYVLIEYSFKSDFFGVKLIKFSLENDEYHYGDLFPESMETDVANIIPVSEEGEIKFLASASREYEKKDINTDIIELTLDGKTAHRGIPLSRSKSPSLYSACCNDVALFCDSIKKDKYNLYMTSKTDVFKQANNDVRISEMMQATSDTLQSLLFSLVYFICYGSLWVIPSLCIASLFSLFEYKFKARNRGLLFMLVYFLAVLIKVFFVYDISYKKYSYFLPAFMTPLLGFSLCFIISILCGIYGYKKYKADLQYNVIALSFSSAIIVDTVLTLLIFVPFIK